MRRLKYTLGALVIIASVLLYSFSSSKSQPVTKGDVLTSVSKNQENSDYLVTASTSQRAVDIATKIIENGGSAMDAGLSVALSEIAESGGKYISYAGIMNLLYFEAETGQVHNMNASWNTLQEENNPMSIPGSNYHLPNPTPEQVDGRSILIPGFMKGVEEAHKKFGIIPFKELFKDAIEVAEKGYKWKAGDLAAFNRNKSKLSKYPETIALFKKEDGSFYKTGDLYKQPDVAKTLRKVSEEGADYMYTGDWAKKFVSKAREIGSKITLNDLRDYEVIWSKPLHKKYNGYDLYVHGFPAHGGLTLIEKLNLAEISGLNKMEHYSKSSEALTTLFDVVETSTTVPFKKELYANLNLSLQSRLKMSTSEEIWKRSQTAKNLSVPEEFKNEHSAAVIAVDKYGNMVAILHSINTQGWGSNGLFVDGIGIPDPAAFQQGPIRDAGPGMRLPEGTNPGIILKDGMPYLAFSCIGSGLANQTFANLLNVLDFDMPPQKAINSPSIGHMTWPGGKPTLGIQPQIFPDSLLRHATSVHHHFVEQRSVISGYWSAIRRDSAGKLSGTSVWLK